MNRQTIATCTLSLGLAFAGAALAAEEQRNQPQQQNNQNQSDAEAAGGGGVRAQQSREGAGSDSSKSSSERDAEISRRFEAGAQAADQQGAAAQPAAAREEAEDAAAMQDPTQRFVKEAYNANLFEIQAGQLAAQRAQDDQVKQLARQMVEDHTKANQQLKQIAQSGQFQVREQLDPIHQMKLQKMQKIPAADFGRKYVNGQVAGHWMGVLEYRYQAKNAQNPKVKEYASQTLPTLEKHLQHVQQMAEQMAGGEARTASERQPADATGAEPAQRQRQGTDATDRPERSNQPAEQPKAD